MARKGKYNPDTVKRITDALSTGATIKDACAHGGITYETYYQWIKKPEFSEAVTRAETNARLAAVGAIRYAIQGFDQSTVTNETYTETRLRRNAKGEEVPYEHTRTVRKTTMAHVAPDWRAAVEYLKRRDPEHWSDRLKVENWQSQAIADIKAGLIQYEPLAEAFDESLATELFRAAGVPIGKN